MKTNDNHVIVEEERPGRLVGVRQPLPKPVHILVAPGEELTLAEREAFERFLRWTRAQLDRKLAA